MHIRKVIIDTLNITDPIAVYADPDRHLLEMLNAKYVGKCHSGCYITSIVGIRRRSQCMVCQDDSPHIATVDIEFEVTGTKYVAGDILVGATVINRNIAAKYILCKMTDKEQIVIYIKSERTTDSIRLGQKIIVYVHATAYRLFASAITINGDVFSHKFSKPEIYNVKGMTVPPELLEQLTAAEKAYSEQKAATPKLWEFFAKYMYCYKTPQKLAAQTTNIHDIIKAPTDYEYIERNPAIDLYTGNFIALEGDQNATGNLVALVQRHINYLNTMVQLQQVYSDLKTDVNLWKIIEMSQLK